LFAEAIVEELKKLTKVWRRVIASGALLERVRSERSATRGYWPARLIVGAQWLTQDVARHLDWLIPWEIRRATAADDSWKQLDETPPIDFAGWEIVRDNLVSFWDWWADGVHLRPQPFRPRGKTSPYVVRLAEEIAPTDLPRIQLPELVRVTTIGAHIGDALFQLNCIVHFEINKATGWLGHQSVFVVDEREAPFRFEGFADTNSDT
jgi:hypothetical protein